MIFIRNLFYLCLRLPLKLCVFSKVVSDESIATKKFTDKQPIFYVLPHQSASDVLSLRSACKAQNLPDPLSPVSIAGEPLSRLLFIEKPSAVFHWRKRSKTNAITQGFQLLNAHVDDEALDAQLIPANVIWGRTPTKEKNTTNVGSLIADQESPSWLRKFFIVLLLGRHNLVRLSRAISFREMADQYGSSEQSARKLMRIARFHFHRQVIAATGPRLMHRKQMFVALLANPAVKKVIKEEAKSQAVSEDKIKKQALKIMDEIAGDYRDVAIRFGERLLGWLWDRLYNTIEVKQANRIRDLAQEGHEIIYVPCHRSHMDYLLLTYVIFQQGLVTPRIAAGINLNFWPAGPIFRKAGAFFIRRSFNGNRLYSTIFREYLGLLFERGYSVKYYSEGGRSRTGRLLPPKTGMLAMTIQSLLRGVQRPLTLVPVYLGYEHVMEVGTYYKELSGSEKKKESIFGVLKAIRNLRNYGNGYVNFGEPININKFLNEQVPEWKASINAIEAQKPQWLTPTVNTLADHVMTRINQGVALNGVALIALILHTRRHKALTKTELITQLDFLIDLQKSAPYHDEIIIPEQSGAQLLSHVESLNKVTINSDSFGDIVSLTDAAILESRYYRNNIIHAFILPSLVCRILESHIKINQDELLTKIQQIVMLFKNDLFLWQNKDDIAKQVQQVCHFLSAQGLAKLSKAGYWSLTNNNESRSQVRILAECVNESVQRLAIITTLLSRLAPIKKAKFEEQVVAIAERLSVLNNINAPEFIDKKAQAILIATMISQGYINITADNELVVDERMSSLKQLLNQLVDIEVLQSILR